MNSKIQKNDGWLARKAPGDSGHTTATVSERAKKEDTQLT
jgi:hypothetical protein